MGTGLSPWLSSEEGVRTLGEREVVVLGGGLPLGLGRQMVEELVEIKAHHRPVPRGQGGLVGLHFTLA